MQLQDKVKRTRKTIKKTIRRRRKAILYENEDGKFFAHSKDCGLNCGMALLLSGVSLWLSSW